MAAEFWAARSLVQLSRLDTAAAPSPPFGAEGARLMAASGQWSELRRPPAQPVGQPLERPRDGQERLLAAAMDIRCAFRAADL